MNATTRSIGLATASAVIALSNVAIVAPAQAKAPAAKGGAAEIVHCYGINTCKGTSDCKSGAHECKGQNDCKGQGFKAISAKACKSAGGRTTE